MQGWVSLHRKLFDNPVMAKPNYLAIWIYLLLRANHKENSIIWNNEKITIQIGQFIGSIKQIADYYKLSKSTVAHILEYFEKDEMIIKKSNKKFSLFEIKNYKKYQEIERQVGRLSNAETLDNKGLNDDAEKLLNGSLFSNCVQIETNNNDNNDNKKDSVQIEFEKFWNYYDLKINKKECFANWLKLTKESKDRIRLHLPKYKKSTYTDGTYPSRKNPLTYLRKEAWNDEIISTSNVVDNLNSQTSLVNKIGVQ